MSGVESLHPSMSSDPQARLWTQIHSLQRRMNALEARRDVIVRSSGSDYVPSGARTLDFDTSGRSFLVLFGSNRILVPAYSGGAPRIGFATIRLNIPTPINIDTRAMSYDTTASGAFQSTEQAIRKVEGVPAGRYTADITISNGTEARVSWLILELPN